MMGIAILILLMAGSGKAIVGGTEVTAERFATNWSFVVALERRLPSGVSATVCTGSLIAPDVVLTAAHCVQNAESSQLVVRANSRDRTLGEAHAIAQISVHAGYQGPESFQSDFAVLELAEPVADAQAIRPLRSSERASFGNAAMGAMAGWGLTPGSQPITLREAERPIPLGSGPIIAGGTPATCGGDSGGPLVFAMPGTGERVLAGVASLGDPNCVDYSVWAAVSGAELLIEPFLGRPSVSAIVSPGQGAAPLATTFQVTASDPDGIVSLTLDPGDGEPRLSRTGGGTFAYTYGSPGDFTASIEATDALGHTGVVTVPVIVSGISAAPVIRVSGSPIQGSVPQVTTWDFSGSTDDGAILQYRLDPGDGGPEVVTATPVLTYSYRRAGVFNAIARVIDNDGYRATRIVVVRFNSGPDLAAPVLRYTVTPASGPAPLLVHFDLRASTDDRGILHYVVHPGVGGDELPAPGGLLDFTYPAVGDYTGYVAVWDGVDDPSHVVGGPFTVSVTSPATVDVLDATVVEAKSTTATVQLVLSRAVAVPVVLNVGTTAPGSGVAARAGVDYVSTTQLVTIPAGAVSASFTVPILGDDTPEVSETIGVRISSASAGVAIGRALALVTILDDDDTTGPVFAKVSNVVVEARFVPVRVSYPIPSAVDAVWGLVPVSCAPLSPIVSALGTTSVRCTAADGARNVSALGFSVTVRTPTTPGAVTNPGNLTSPILETSKGRQLLVSAGGFAAGSPVMMRVISGSRSWFLTDAGATADGRIDVRIKIPHETENGPAEIRAEGLDSGGNVFVRAWQINIKGQ
jgi:hypothetical protein